METNLLKPSDEVTHTHTASWETATNSKTVSSKDLIIKNVLEEQVLSDNISKESKHEEPTTKVASETDVKDFSILLNLSNKTSRKNPKNHKNPKKLEEESEFSQKPDVVRKLTLRALKNVVFDALSAKLEEYKRVYNINLKYKPEKNRKRLYNFLKSSFESLLGYEIHKPDFLKIYPILYHLIIGKKDVENKLNLSKNEDKITVKEELKLFIKQSTICTAKDSVTFRKNIIMTCAKHTLNNNEWYAEKFWERIYSTKKKKGMQNKERIKVCVLAELNKISDYPSFSL